MRKLVCINCPRGCDLVVDDNLEVTGNFCPRGRAYAISEVTNPSRLLTSTMKIISIKEVRCPVRTNIPIPKGLLKDAMKIVNKTLVVAPIHIGDVIIENILNTGADVIATKNIEE